MKRCLIFAVVLCVLVGCTPSHSPIKPKSEWDSVFVRGDFRFYGAYYPTVSQNIFSIDLLSRGLEFDSSYKMVGNGTNLYLSDVFLPLTDSALQSGIYDIDTTASAYTFLGGKRFGESVTGTYLVRVSESAVQDVVLLTRGQMTVTTYGDSIALDFQLYTEDSALYSGTYSGPVSYR